MPELFRAGDIVAHAVLLAGVPTEIVSRSQKGHERKVIFMPLSMLFWLIMVLWLFYGLAVHVGELRSGIYWPLAGNFLIFVLLFLLGWKVFGFVVQP